MVLENAGIQVVVDKAISLDKERLTLTVASGGRISCERLVLATGTEAITPRYPRNW